MEKLNQPILFFDGHCNLCNGAVRFVLKHERNELLQFAALQSETLKSLHPPILPDSLVFFTNNKFYTESTAALKLIPFLKWYFRWFMILWIFPEFLRNWVYRFIAKNRIRWFGASMYCAVMQPQWRHRFLA